MQQLTALRSTFASILYSNRSKCNAALADFDAAVADAARCVELDPTFTKGYFRKASAELQLGDLEAAAATAASGMALEEAASSGQDSEFKRLVRSIAARQKQSAGGAENLSSLPPPPKKLTAKDFEMGHEMGVGNFTRIVLATHKASGKNYALKLIQKTEVDRMKRRHPNIHNEIQMEKRALSKLRHPGVITLYATFQDYYCLYFQMEHITGGELWSRIIKDDCMVGAPVSLVQFWAAEIVTAVEYIHSQGIVHRYVRLFGGSKLPPTYLSPESFTNGVRHLLSLLRAQRPET